ncbi:large ribosomal subunit protein mL52 [Cloeon dipterum]|uniref:large ribosomal subunit protein mL52 n=1 Tax=Cloeon dipterum TaxID=197152 RepID=UPI0032204BBD
MQIANLSTPIVRLPFLRHISLNPFSTSSTMCDYKFRLRNKLPINHNASGPLTDGPDFSYLDSNKPAPPGKGQLKRLLKNQQLANTVLKLNAEIQFAIDAEKRLQLEAQQETQKILDAKLKPKGDALISQRSRKLK